MVHSSKLAHDVRATGVAEALQFVKTHLSWAVCSRMSRPCCEWKQSRNKSVSARGGSEVDSFSAPGPERVGWGSRGEQKHTQTGLEVQ